MSIAILIAVVAAAALGVPPEPQNVLVIVADDMGPELVAAYHKVLDPPPTPRLDALAENGVRFANAWSAPRCSPTRVTILTGRYGFHTGVGTNVNPNGANWAMQLDEVTLPEFVGGTHATACFGKWHIGNATVGGDLAPNLAGFDHFAGYIQPLRFEPEWFEYDEVVDGVTGHVEEYRTTHIVNRAAAWIDATSEPWLAVVNFNNPHPPLHVPPLDLHSFEPPLDDEGKRYAMVEAMDTEIGRLLDGIDPEVASRTTVIFCGDNGLVLKGTVYEGGVRVPFIVSGAAVQDPGRVVNGLVQTVDIYATVADILGSPVDGHGLDLDSISFLPHLQNLPAGSAPVREYAFTEIFDPNGLGTPTSADRAIRDIDYKLVRRNGIDELYDMRADPSEDFNLLLPENGYAHRAPSAHQPFVVPGGESWFSFGASGGPGNHFGTNPALPGQLSPDVLLHYAELAAELDALLAD